MYVITDSILGKQTRLNHGYELRLIFVRNAEYAATVIFAIQSVSHTWFTHVFDNNL